MDILSNTTTAEECQFPLVDRELQNALRNEHLFNNWTVIAFILTKYLDQVLLRHLISKVLPNRIPISFCKHLSGCPSRNSLSLDFGLVPSKAFSLQILFNSSYIVKFESEENLLFNHTKYSYLKRKVTNDEPLNVLLLIDLYSRALLVNGSFIIAGFQRALMTDMIQFMGPNIRFLKPPPSMAAGTKIPVFRKAIDWKKFENVELQIREADFIPIQLTLNLFILEDFEPLYPSFVKFYQIIHMGAPRHGSMWRITNLSQCNGTILIMVGALVLYIVIDWLLIGRKINVEWSVTPILFGQGPNIYRPHRVSLVIFYILCIVCGYFAYVISSGYLVSLLTTPPPKLRTLKAVQESKVPMYIFELKPLVREDFLENSRRFIGREIRRLEEKPPGQEGLVTVSNELIGHLIDVIQLAGLNYYIIPESIGMDLLSYPVTRQSPHAHRLNDFCSRLTESGLFKMYLAWSQSQFNRMKGPKAAEDSNRVTFKSFESILIMYMVLVGLSMLVFVVEVVVGHWDNLKGGYNAMKIRIPRI